MIDAIRRWIVFLPRCYLKTLKYVQCYLLRYVLGNLVFHIKGRTWAAWSRMWSSFDLSSVALKYLNSNNFINDLLAINMLW